MTPRPHAPTALDELLRTLLVELFQTQESTREQCAREAARGVGGIAGIDAMRALAEQGEVHLEELEVLAAARGAESTRRGRLVGGLFSNVREHFADKQLNAERSWRMTLAGLRHGIDVMASVVAVAEAAGDAALAAVVARFKEERVPLVEKAAAALPWFAAHPERAKEPAVPGLARRLRRRLRRAPRLRTV